MKYEVQYSREVAITLIVHADSEQEAWNLAQKVTNSPVIKSELDTAWKYGEGSIQIDSLTPIDDEDEQPACDIHPGCCDCLQTGETK